MVVPLAVIEAEAIPIPCASVILPVTVLDWANTCRVNASSAMISNSFLISLSFIFKDR
jgi:hypothetical protein